MRKIRGNRISMIFQEPMTSLNPVMRIGDQITEVLRLHRDMTSRETWAKAVEMLALVRIPEPERRAQEYPHQLSGGMRQRAMIAMALACRPALLIADEPTTALDVTIQAQILALIVDLQKTLGTGLILITHDLGVVAQTAQRVIVMYAGKKVEEATRGRSVRESATPLYARADGLDAGGDFVRRQDRCAAERNSRHGAVADQPAGGLRLSRRAAASPSIAAAPNTRRCRKSMAAISRRAGARRNWWARHDRSNVRCSRSPTSSNTTPCAAASCAVRSAPYMPSTASASRSARARRSAWSANPAAANRRSRAACCGWSSLPPAPSSSTATISRASARPRCGRTGARCRSCSRTRSPRSIRA